MLQHIEAPMVFLVMLLLFLSLFFNLTISIISSRKRNISYRNHPSHSGHISCIKKGLPSTLVIALLVVSTLSACVSGIPRVTPQVQAATPTSPDLVVPYPLPSATVPSPPIDPYPIPSATMPPYTPVPTWTPEPPMPTPTIQPTLTSIPAAQLEGEWSRYTTADGFCTDSPILMGQRSIGTGTTTICDYHYGEWSSRVIHQGTTVTAAWYFGNGLATATDEGICYFIFAAYWQCETQAEGFPYPGIRQILNIRLNPVYMTADSVVFLESIYHLPEIVGAAGAIPTQMAISGVGVSEGYLPVEIWVGTNGYGVVVIRPGTGEITRYTTQDGLPDNDIRDISSPSPGCGRPTCDFREVWAATGQGIAQWDGSQWKTYITADGLPSNDIRGVSSGGRNVAWAATAGGAAYFDGQTWRAFTQVDGLPEGELTGVEWAGNEVLFSTPASGLIVFTIKNLTH